MFIDIVTTTRSELELIDEETGLFSDPPGGLLAAVAWEAEDPDEVTVLHVWKTPEERGEFAFKKIMPLAKAGKVVSNPKRLTPVKVFLRS